MADSKKCMIIGASPVKSDAVFKEFNPEEYIVICADGGYDTALKFKISPDYIVGDFDSCNVRPNTHNKNVFMLPQEKDFTDTMYAALLGLKLGCKDFIMIGCTGGAREDHTMANYNVMLYIANKGGWAVMVDDKMQSFLLRGRKITLTEMKGSTVSVFPFGTGSCNVTYNGLKYPMNEGDLIVGDTLMGVSNEIVSDRAEIKVHIGCALVMILK